LQATTDYSVSLFWARTLRLVQFGATPGEIGGTYEAFVQRVHLEALPVVNAEVGVA
jgi:hypothetical protein